MRRGLLPAVLLLTLTMPARGDVRLEWKFKTDDHFYAEETTALKLTLDGAGAKSESDTETTILYSFTVKKAERDETVLEEKIESVKSSGKLERALEGLRGAVFTLTLNRENQVTKLEGYSEALKKMNLGDETTMKLLRTAFDEDSVRRGASQLFGAFPAKTVGENAHWKRDQSMNLGALGTLDFTTIYTYKGKSKDGEEVWSETTADYQPPKQGDTDPKFVKSEVTAQPVKGQLTFNAETGRLLREESGCKLEGTVTLEIKGKEQTVRLAMEQSRKVRVGDKPPQ